MIELLAGLRWQDVVDILLVAFVIYRIFVLIKGTRALQMLVGLAFLVLAYVGSQVFELFALHWILNAFLTSIILVVVVLFQNEIRRALAHVGVNPFGPKEGSSTGAQAVEELMKASVSLANKKTGALLVLQRETDLEDYVDKGVRLDAALSRELLVSVFLPYSPIHDGAVLVCEGRAMWAGCFLPLTSRADVDKDLGTRHRAAIGITEETDAVVIVVSEETGGISVVLNGRMTRNLDGASLRRVLLKLFPQGDARAKKPRKASPKARAKAPPKEVSG
ncbi:MAG: diadenylate cyclase CdaA [Deferrisomatales bacterium]|nr:diadenylate cyclase CdaA [Deferrisomatales bacterium]